MKNEDSIHTVAFSSNQVKNITEKDSFLERFTYWFREFLENSE